MLCARDGVCIPFLPEISIETFANRSSRPFRCHAAAMSGNNEGTQLILQKSSKNVNMTLAVSLITPLHYAAESDYFDVTKTLLAHGADTRMAQRNSGYNALHLAIRADVSMELIKLLLSSVKGYDRQKLLDGKVWGDAAIHMAAEHARTSTMQTLLDFGAQLESTTGYNGDTALTMAARTGKRTAVEFFLEKGANINAGDSWGKTALMIAAENGYVRTAEMLLGKGANVKATSDNGNTTLHLTARNAGDMSSQSSGDIIRMLLSEGADVNAKNSKNQTPLDKAANRKDDATIFLLRSYGAVLYKPNKDIREKYTDLFDQDPNANTAITQGSVDSLHTTQSGSPSLSTADTTVDQELEGREKNESMLKRLSLNDGGDALISEEPAEVEKEVEPRPPPLYTNERKSL